jgi:hypothetical protein
MTGGVYAATALASAKDDTQYSSQAPSACPLSVRCMRVRPPMRARTSEPDCLSLSG